jgi:hypothetical protein
VRLIQCCVLALVLVFSLVASLAAQVAMDGYDIHLLADGFNGPEGLRVLGAGQVILVESGSDLAPGQPREDLEPRLLQVKRNGKVRVLAEGPDMTWVDVEHDPSRGYFVTELLRAVYGGDPGGVQRVRSNGDASVFATFPGDAIGIAVDRSSGDLYVSNSAARIERIAPDGTVTSMLGGVRANGLCHLGDDRLLAAVWRDFRFGDPGSAFVVNSLIEFDLATGAETTLVAGLGSTMGFLACPSSGEIFVADQADGEVRRLTPDSGGYTIETFASGFSGSSLSFPGGSFNGVGVGADGSVYVSDFGAGELYSIRRSRGR